MSITCLWVCGAPADWPVKYQGGKVVTYCLTHAQHECYGGQADWYLRMGNQPISWSDHTRISQDGPYC